MNYTQMKHEAHTIHFDEILKFKRGRIAYYVDSRNKLVNGEYHVHPIAEANFDIYVICPYCQTIHRHLKKYIRRNQGYVEANCKGRLVFEGKVALLDRGFYFIEGWYEQLPK